MAEYSRQRHDWRLVALRPGLVERGTRFDGAISYGDLPVEPGPRLPSLVMIGSFGQPGLPRVRVDDDAVGRLGAEHLLSAGFRHLAFVNHAPLDGALYAARRFDSFAATAAAAGAAVHVSPLPYWANAYGGAEVDVAALADWLVALPKPAGVMGANDGVARHVVDACRLAGVRVPQEVAVLGVDDDEIICAMTDPPLSSVAQPLQRIGYTAAALLGRLLDGEPPPPPPVLLPPTGVTVRPSTDVLAVERSDVASAVTFIRAHATDPRLDVAAVADAAGLGRRSLERHFRRALGRPVVQEIQRVRVELARHMLTQRHLTIHAVARQCGFPSPNHFHRVFRRFAGTSPGDYRRQHLGSAV